MFYGFFAPACHTQSCQVHIEVIHIGFFLPHGHIRAFFDHVLLGQLVIKIQPQVRCMLFTKHIKPNKAIKESMGKVRDEIIERFGDEPRVAVT
jgi:hypothetical protein